MRFPHGLTRPRRLGPDHPGVGGDAVDPRGLFRADCNLHDEARAEFAALIKFLEIGEECLPDRFVDERPTISQSSQSQRATA